MALHSGVVVSVSGEKWPEAVIMSSLCICLIRSDDVVRMRCFFLYHLGGDSDGGLASKP